jgi:hypothetical protein
LLRDGFAIKKLRSLNHRLIAPRLCLLAPSVSQPRVGQPGRGGVASMHTSRECAVAGESDDRALLVQIDQADHQAVAVSVSKYLLDTHNYDIFTH